MAVPGEGPGEAISRSPDGDTTARNPIPAQGGAEPHYPEPVDPWATGEAAWTAGHSGQQSTALSASSHPLYAGPSWPPATGPTPGAAVADRERRGPGGRAYRIGVVVAVVTLVIGAGVAAAVIFWPRNPALDFHALGAARTFDPMVPVNYYWSGTTTLGDRAYFASSDADGKVGVVAVDTEAGAEVWRSDKAGRARWSALTALPGGLALVSDYDYDTSKKRLVMLNAEDGDPAWQKDLASEDKFYFGHDVLVVNHSEERTVRGYRLTDGSEKWARKNPETDRGNGSWLIPVTTPDDVATPVNTEGRAFGPVIGAGGRLVQLSPDGSARLIDAASGKLGKSGKQIATFEDSVIAHNGRLIVWESGQKKRLVSYDLTRFGEPTVLYSPASDIRVKDLVPCGDDRVCLLEQDSSDTKKTLVRAVPADRSGSLWEHPLAEVETIVPVGESVLAGADETTTLIKPDGTKEWDTTGAVARLDRGNMLRFFGGVTSSTQNVAVSGAHVGDPPVDLGALHRVRSTTCSWNTSVVACVAEEKFVVQRFAG